MAYILYRGEYDKRRDPVKADTPDVLPPMPSDLPQEPARPGPVAAPARAPADGPGDGQPVLAGGLRHRPGPDGRRLRRHAASCPSHPELLDWLAVEFRESGWDVKRFFKLLVTSAAYRQSAAATPEKLEKDPPNRLLSRGPRFRMDAEMVRDYALAASGLLVEQDRRPERPAVPARRGLGGRGDARQQHPRLQAATRGESLYRRSLYTFWKRAAPPASMDIFNAPSREVCTVRRERTNTPLQALVTLNDPQFVEAARHLAELDPEGGRATPPRPGIDFLARRLLARPLRAEESRGRPRLARRPARLLPGPPRRRRRS